MDWISVASEGLSNINTDIDVNFGYNHLETLNLMQYIICVDHLTESIIQLYRVLYNTNTYLLSEDQEIFKQSKISDDKYFKHIRAVFSTHPVNLDSLDGIKSQNGEKFYASWVSKDWLGENDFNVYLYSNDPLKDDRYFGLNINDINRYAEKRYGLLIPLMEKVEEILDKHRDYYKNKNIATDDNVVKQLEILIEENSLRFGFNYGYAGIINYLYRMMKVDLNSDGLFNLSAVKEYRDFMFPFVPEIKSRLQNMDNEIVTLPSTATGYKFEKIYSYLFNHEHPLGEQYFRGLIKKGILPTYLLNCDDFDEKQLVLDALLHKEFRSRLKPMSFEDLID